HDAHHGHGADNAGMAMPLAPGEKWETDAPLRDGMTEIRSAVERALKAAHGGTDDEGQYQALGATVDLQLAHIVQNCKLAPEADAALHEIIGELVAGGQAVSSGGSDARMIGVVRLVTALDAYGVSFDHPGWQPVDTGH
ncbi:MAG: hypothetical protein ACLGHG_07205, partial [Gammaproteobacteria bacterium]